MADNNSAISDVAQKGLQTANTVRGAVKAGKAIAAAAKGASAGGAIGAVAAFAYENRGLVVAIVIGLIVILLIPVVIISMLPTLIFGGISNAYSTTDTENPVLNSPTAITQNIAAVSTSLETLLTNGLNTVFLSINQDKSTLPADTNVLVVYPTISEININTTLIISQYCAYKNSDYTTVSLTDLVTIVNNNITKLYRYEKSEQILPVQVEITTVDSETGEETKTVTIVEKNFTVYTVFFNGENYFADNIFYLTDEQKQLANNYSENLSVYLNGGI